ncbi:phosphopentomutase [Ahrensia kielensis]|uniref:Phosphopentomutase n=1 Tax=Ahrensia kielensis TaxID=76980 RepID=A0ABU9T9P1_9HYPH
MARAFLFVMDSVGLGGANDAAQFNDEGSNTVGHILEHTENGKADKTGLREGPLQCPNLADLGFFHALELASAHPLAKTKQARSPYGFWGVSDEVSNGKDTPSGHWEIAGLPVTFDWGYFPHKTQTFPQALLDSIYKEAGIEGSLANCHSSGTEALTNFGDEHIQFGQPIFYTSSDSVFQIAAHETHFGLERLYALCETVRKLVDPYNIGRVIARPFLGDAPDNFVRTGNRRDYSVLPPEPTLLDRLTSTGKRVTAVGKIGDIFAHQGISEVIKANGNDALADATLEAMADADDGDLVFTNFIDFDQLYGHRRDVAGYASALEHFDKRLPEFIAALKHDDLMIITADHGCDPTWTGSDHTRERIPIVGLLKGSNAKGAQLGIRKSFADIGETIAAHLGVPAGKYGTSFIDKLKSDA